jgi:hypothetical protein
VAAEAIRSFGHDSAGGIGCRASAPAGRSTTDTLLAFTIAREQIRHKLKSPPGVGGRYTQSAEPGARVSALSRALDGDAPQYRARNERWRVGSALDGPSSRLSSTTIAGAEASSSAAPAIPPIAR